MTKTRNLPFQIATRQGVEVKINTLSLLSFKDLGLQSLAPGQRLPGEMLEEVPGLIALQAGKILHTRSPALALCIILFLSLGNDSGAGDRPGVNETVAFQEEQGPAAKETQRIDGGDGEKIRLENATFSRPVEQSDGLFFPCRQING